MGNSFILSLGQNLQRKDGEITKEVLRNSCVFSSVKICEKSAITDSRPPRWGATIDVQILYEVQYILHIMILCNAYCILCNAMHIAYYAMHKGSSTQTVSISAYSWHFCTICKMPCLVQRIVKDAQLCCLTKRLLQFLQTNFSIPCKMYSSCTAAAACW